MGPRAIPLRYTVYAAIVGVVLAIGVPSFCRARMSPGESPQIGRLRSMISAQAAYSGVNGFYDHPRCLVQPQSCIPAYAAGAPTFLDPDFLEDVRYGYRWTFHAGPAAPADVTRARRSSPSSILSWAYVAVPVKTGKAFCGDAGGRICVTDGVEPAVEAGACAPDPRCRTL